MQTLGLKNLFLSSLVASTAACSPVCGYRLTGTKAVEAQPIVDKHKALLYKAEIDLYRRHYSGLILLKQLDTATAHLTFVTEIGMKIFDFEVKKDSLKAVYVFEPLNKPRIIQLLKSDLQLILLQGLWSRRAEVYEKKDRYIYKIKDNFHYYYQMNAGAPTVSCIIKKGRLFTKEKVSYQYSADMDANFIKLKHKGWLPLRMTWLKLDKKNE